MMKNKVMGEGGHVFLF